MRLFDFLGIPLDRVSVYFLSLEGCFQSLKDACECVACSETQDVMDNGLFVELVDWVRREGRVKPEDYGILGLPIVLDELARENVIRRVVTGIEPLVELEALSDL